MKEQVQELQKLKGVGDVLSRRLVEASYDTIFKVAAAEIKGLERIAGMNPRKDVKGSGSPPLLMGRAVERRHQSESEQGEKPCQARY